MTPGYLLCTNRWINMSFIELQRKRKFGSQRRNEFSFTCIDFEVSFDYSSEMDKHVHENKRSGYKIHIWHLSVQRS